MCDVGDERVPLGVPLCGASLVDGWDDGGGYEVWARGGAWAGDN